MFPLAIPLGSGLASPVPPGLSTAQSVQFSVQTDIAALSRQQLPVAVSALGAPVAYSPDTLPSRLQQRTSNAVNAAVPQLADGEANAEGDALVAADTSDAPDIYFFNLRPNRLGLSFSAQFAAHYLAQETRAEGAREIKYTLTPNRTGLPKARGAEAYSIAVARNGFQPPAEQVAL